ncbi:MAG: hypothetical protein LBD76_01550 [Prevotellaceae bacterium]|nr:hypothetical protein [Prevotellaceae bacterium]
MLFFLCHPSLLDAQNNLIPNTQDCSATRPPFAFNIQKKWTTTTGNKIFTDCTPIAGDIDGDGKTEIFAAGNSNGSAGYGNIIYIFDGNTGSSVGSISVANVGYWAWTGTSFLIYRDKSTGKGRVFVSADNGIISLFQVSSNPGVRPITFTLLWSKTGFTGHNSPVISDLDGDGNPEFIAGKRIFDHNGNLKATMAYGGQITSWDPVYLPIVGDVDNDEKPEIIVGTNVYKYNGSTISLYASCPGISNQEGSNMIADVNQDGNVDVIFHSWSGGYSNSNGFIRVWTPKTGALLGIVATGLSGQRSIPFVADIDGVITNGKKYPEICYNTASNLYAYRYTGSGFALKWTKSHSDASGATILTLYDFNNDGVFELIYRDQTNLQIFNGSGSTPVSVYTTAAGSETASELPIVVDATGDGSADIVVTGGAANNWAGEIMLFEGGASKWISCPNVWNQQFYSNLHVNVDLTIPTKVKPVNLTFTRPDYSTVQLYNGGPLQALYVSEETYLPVDLSPDVYVVSGNITFNSSSSVTLTVTFGNQGLVTATANTPIRYYKNAIASANIIGNATLGVDLSPGQTTTITKTFTGLSPMPTQFYVRILDDGTNFPASGAYSDCNLTNNTKSFGTLELHKTVNSLNSCIDGTSIFNIELINNTNLSQSPQTFNNIILTDSLGSGWNYISSTAIDGSLGAYNSSTRKIKWTVPSIAPGATAKLTILAKSTVAAAIRNTVWVESVNGTTLGKEVIEAYVIVNSALAPAAASISPANPTICSGSSVILTASVSGKSSYQWYKNNEEISGATQRTYTATTSGNYTVTYFEEPCVSQMSAAVTVAIKTQATAAIVNVNGTTSICSGNTTVLTANNTGSVTNPVYKWYDSQTNLNSFYSGVSYTTPTLTETTKYYVGVEGDNYCVNTANNRKEVIVTVNAKPSLNSSNISKVDVACNGGSTGSITVNVSGVNQYSMNDGSTWQTGSNFSSLAAGTYQIKVKTANNCESETVPVIISEPAAALTATSLVTDLSCNGGVNDGEIVITASGGTSPYQYSIDSGSTYGASATFNNLSIGAYGIRVKDANGCVAGEGQTAHVSQPLQLYIPTPVATTPATCNGGNNGSITVSNVTGGTQPYEYSFDDGATYGSNNTKTGLSAGVYYIRIKDAHNCVSSSVTATVAEPSVLLLPSNVSAAIACPNLPATITINNTVTSVYYDIYDTLTGGTSKKRGTGNGSNIDIDMGIVPETTTFYIETVFGGCTSVSRVPITVIVRETTLNYPDIRIQVCPDIANVNLSKYIDTVDLVSLNWTASSGAIVIDANTGIISSTPSTTGVYTLKYKASSHCVASKERKVYLHVVNDKKIFAPRDTVAICWKYAEALRINQLFGIEATGVWSTSPFMMSYLYLSPSSSPYAGALIFNGKAAYEYGTLPTITYHGEAARQIEFYYTIPAGNCLGNKVYKIVIVLTPNIVK